MLGGKLNTLLAVVEQQNFTKAAKALADSYFEAVDMIKKEPAKSFGLMGADVKQSAEQFEASQKYLRWQDKEANRKFFAGEQAAFSKEAADLAWGRTVAFLKKNLA